MAEPVQVDWNNDFLLMRTSPIQILTILLAYLVFVLKLGPAFMKNRPAFQLKTPLLVYNTAQVLYSLFLVCIYSSIMFEYGFLRRKCDVNHVDESKALLMIVSAGNFYFIAKVSELLDTVFYVLRKKTNQVTFLHVYHHSMMMLSTWAVIKYSPSYIVMFIELTNSFVHVIMYTYYGLSAFPSLVKYLWWKKYLTSIQLIQFGLQIIYVVVASALSECTPPYVLLFHFLFNLFLMIYLFRDFYLKAYVKKENCVKGKIA